MYYETWIMCSKMVPNESLSSACAGKKIFLTLVSSYCTLFAAHSVCISLPLVQLAFPLTLY